MTARQALDIFDLKNTNEVTEDILKKMYRKLSKENHPDLGGDASMQIKINRAYEVLKEFLPSERKDRASTGRSGNRAKSPVARDWTDIDKCKQDILEYSKKRGEVYEYYISAHDGEFFRHGATVLTNESSLSFACDVIAYWNSHGGSPHKSEAVLVNRKGSSTWRFASIRGKSVLLKNIAIDCDSMPWNDSSCARKIRSIIQGVDTVA